MRHADPHAIDRTRRHAPAEGKRTAMGTYASERRMANGRTPRQREAPPHPSHASRAARGPACPQHAHTRYPCAPRAAARTQDARSATSAQSCAVPAITASSPPAGAHNTRNRPLCPSCDSATAHNTRPTYPALYLVTRFPHEKALPQRTAPQGEPHNCGKTPDSARCGRRTAHNSAKTPRNATYARPGPGARTTAGTYPHHPGHATPAQAPRAATPSENTPDAPPTRRHGSATFPYPSRARASIRTVPQRPGKSRHEGPCGHGRRSSNSTTAEATGPSWLSDTCHVSRAAEPTLQSA